MSHNTHDYPPPTFAVTVDILVLTIEDGKLKVLLIEHDEAPFLGCVALPGGFVGPNETLREAAERELKQDTNITVRGRIDLRQFRSYYVPQRDPRQPITTVVYWTIINSDKLARILAAGNIRTAALRPYKSVTSGRIDLAFDHKRIIRDGVKRIRRRLEGTTVATKFLKKTFTVSDLRKAYEIMWDTTLDKGNFQRKVINCEDFLIDTLTERGGASSGRPAALYTAGPARFLTSTISMPDKSWL